MPVNYNCHICHGDPETSMLCSACRWDDDVAFQQIADLQIRMRYIEEKIGSRSPKEDTTKWAELQSGELNRYRSKLTFDEVIENVDGRSLQRVFREIDDNVLAGVLYALDTPEKVSKIRKNVSANHFKRLLDCINDGWTRRAESSIEEFMKIIRQLEEMGEIVVARSDEVFLPGFFDTTTFTEEEIAKQKTDRIKFWEDYKIEQKEKLRESINRVAEWKEKVGLNEKA